MGMVKISIEEVKRIAEEYNLNPCKIPGTEVVMIRKRRSDNLEDISWEEFSSLLRKRNLAVYKARNSDYLRIMRDR